MHYFTKTGIELSIINGLGQGTGLSCGDLKLVDSNHDLFIARPKQKPMTKGELYVFEQRVEEIGRIIELCDDSGRDQNVIDNLQLELDYIVNKLERSERVARKNKKGVSK